MVRKNMLYQRGRATLYISWCLFENQKWDVMLWLLWDLEIY